MARPNKCRNICSMPQVTEFVPAGGVRAALFWEWMRLRSSGCWTIKNLRRNSVLARMNISRTTVTRIYEDARRKIAEAMVFRQAYRHRRGDVMVCQQMKPECKMR